VSFDQALALVECMCDAKFRFRFEQLRQIAEVLYSVLLVCCSRSMPVSQTSFE
jgi:hypothetical protein